MTATRALAIDASAAARAEREDAGMMNGNGASVNAARRHWELWLSLAILAGLAVGSRYRPHLEPARLERTATASVAPEPELPQIRRLGESEGLVILHDDRRFVTCYVTRDGSLYHTPTGIACLPDVDIGELRK